MKLRQRIFRHLSKEVKDTSGTATVETVLWLPFFFALFIFIVDVSFVFYGQSQIHRIVQNANRQMSVGRLSDAAETKVFIETALLNLSPNSEVVTTLNGAGAITSVVKTPTTDLMAVGIMSFANIDLYTKSSHLVEY